MAIKIRIGERFTFPVEGTYNDESGTAVPFEFKLTAKRLLADELHSALHVKESSLGDFLCDVVVGWSGVIGDDESSGAPVPFSREALAKFLQQLGLANLIYKGYLEQSGVKEKN